MKIAPVTVECQEMFPQNPYCSPPLGPRLELGFVPPLVLTQVKVRPIERQYNGLAYYTLVHI